MNVRVRLPTQLRHLVAGDAVVEVPLDGGADGVATVAMVLDSLALQHPALERRIRDEQGRARAHVNLFIGADNVRDRHGLATPVNADEEVSIIPAVSGG